MDENDVDMTAVVRHHGLYRYRSMLFGLENAVATFQRVMDVILASVKWQFPIGWLYRRCHYHLQVAKGTCETYRRSSDTAHGSRSDTEIKEVSFHFQINWLPQTCDYPWQAASCKKADAIESPQYPEDIFQMWSFLGLCTIYWRFVLGLAKIAVPLNRKWRRKNLQSLPLTGKKVER